MPRPRVPWSAAAAEIAIVLAAVMDRLPCPVCDRPVSPLDLQPLLGDTGPHACTTCRRHAAGDDIPQERP